MSIIKPLSNSIVLSATTGNTVANATLVYVTANTNTRCFIVVANTTVNNYSILLGNNASMCIEKLSTDLLFTDTASTVHATKIAYRN